MKERLSYTLLFVVISMGVMMGLIRPYLIETAQLTPFLTTRVFAQEMITRHTWGIVYYAASFMQSCLARPWLGASLLTTMLVAIAYVTRWATNLSDKCFGICWIVPFLLITRYAQMGYMVYVNKEIAIAFAWPLFTLLSLIVAGLLIKGLRYFFRNNKPQHQMSKALSRTLIFLSFIAFTGSAYLFWNQTYKDQNFLNSLQMKQAGEQGNWEQIIRLARENHQEPTRLQVCLNRLALYKTGKMGEQLFAFPDGSATYNAPEQQQWLRLMGAQLLYYNYGKTGFAYRWAMEDMVEYGMRPMYLRTLYRVALLNGETMLAKKYHQALCHTLFYKEETNDIEREAQTIRPLMNYTDQLDGDNGLVEFYLLQSFTLTKGGSREMVELSLMCSLITKQLEGFWPRFMALLPGWQGIIPIHYQEAALMVAQLQGGIDINTLPIDPQVRQRFERLVEVSAQMGDSANNAYNLKSEFGNTYWYYYFFVEGLKTT
ncbi:MAG: hypothetical protein J5671_09490 [Bacteroidaceae bacterium]|nr:hypothetical protein [Bacteroidaceae bacterium]